MKPSHKKHDGIDCEAMVDETRKRIKRKCTSVKRRQVIRSGQARGLGSNLHMGRGRRGPSYVPLEPSPLRSLLEGCQRGSRRLSIITSIIQRDYAAGAYVCL